MMDDRTRRNLINVAPPLVHLCYMMDEAGHEFIVPDPPRTKLEQVALYAQGREPLAEVNAKRKVAGIPEIKADKNIRVSWTLDSKHIIGPDGFAHAFDFVNKPVNYEDVAAFERLGVEFEKMAHKLGIEIEWGGRWKAKDLPHIELKEKT